MRAVGHQFTIGSPKQLGEILFEELRLPKGRKTKTGYSTDATVLEELRGVHPAIAPILDWRIYTKLRSTLADRVQRAPGLADGRLGLVARRPDRSSPRRRGGPARGRGRGPRLRRRAHDGHRPRPARAAPVRRRSAAARRRGPTGAPRFRAALPPPGRRRGRGPRRARAAGRARSSRRAPGRCARGASSRASNRRRCAAASRSSTERWSSARRDDRRPRVGLPHVEAGDLLFGPPGVERHQFLLLPDPGDVVVGLRDAQFEADGGHLLAVDLRRQRLDRRERRRSGDARCRPRSRPAGSPWSAPPPAAREGPSGRASCGGCPGSRRGPTRRARCAGRGTRPRPAWRSGAPVTAAAATASAYDGASQARATSGRMASGVRARRRTRPRPAGSARARAPARRRRRQRAGRRRRRSRSARRCGSRTNARPRAASSWLGTTTYCSTSPRQASTARS